MRVSRFLAGVTGVGRVSPREAPEPQSASPALSDILAAINDGAERRKPQTLLCYQCGRTYDNRGTFLRGSACPDCHPEADEAERATA